MFEDYGETFAYEQNIYLEKKFVVNGDAKKLTIKQSMEGLYTPRYEGYHFKINGLPFVPSKIVADGKEIGSISANADKTYEFKFTKNFKFIEIFG